jgi:hypothetical protein
MYIEGITSMTAFCRILVCCLLGLSVSARANSAFKVGSFTKSIGASGVSQTVAHGLGTTPKAMIFWTGSATSQAFTNILQFGLGITDGTHSYSLSTASQNNVNPTNTSHRIAQRLLTIVQGGEILVAEASLTSLDATNVVMTWTTNNATAYVIHYIAIGGSDISATVQNWTLPTTTGNASVTGTGFRPNVVWLFNASDNLTGAAPTSSTSAGFGQGVIGAGGEQWALAGRSADAVATSNSARAQRVDSAVYATDDNGVITKQASYVSMDADGFTLNYSVANANASQAISLALRGVNAGIGSFAKTINTSVPVTQSVTGLGFKPNLVILSSDHDSVTPDVTSFFRQSFGASDGTTEGSTLFSDASGNKPSLVQSLDKTSKVICRNTQDNAGVLLSEADLTSMDAGGFTLTWTTNDNEAPFIEYVALGGLSMTDTEIEFFTATQQADGTRLVWDADYLPDAVGFDVVREDAFGQKQQRNGSLLFTSELLTRATTFSWLDAQTGDTDGKYWLKIVDFDGTFTWAGPATVASPRPTTGSTQLGEAIPGVVSGCALDTGAPSGIVAVVSLLILRRRRAKQREI